MTTYSHAEQLISLKHSFFRHNIISRGRIETFNSHEHSTWRKIAQYPNKLTFHSVVYFQWSKYVHSLQFPPPLSRRVFLTVILQRPFMSAANATSERSFSQRERRKHYGTLALRNAQLLQGSYTTPLTVFQDFPADLLRCVCQDPVRHVEFYQFFYTVNVTFTTHCYWTLHIIMSYCIQCTCSQIQLNARCDQTSSVSGSQSVRSSKNLSHLLFMFPWLSRM